MGVNFLRCLHSSLQEKHASATILGLHARCWKRRKVFPAQSSSPPTAFFLLFFHTYIGSDRYHVDVRLIVWTVRSFIVPPLNSSPTNPVFFVRAYRAISNSLQCKRRIKVLVSDLIIIIIFSLKPLVPVFHLRHSITVRAYPSTYFLQNRMNTFIFIYLLFNAFFFFHNVIFKSLHKNVLTVGSANACMHINVR